MSDRFQLALSFESNREGFRGSEPVQNRPEPSESSSERIDSSSETSEIVNDFTVPYRVANSLMISAGPSVLPKGRNCSEPVSLAQSPLPGERVLAALVSPGDRGGRADAPDVARSEANERGTGGTDQALAAPSEQAGIRPAEPTDLRTWPTGPILRPYQEQSVSAVQGEFAAGRRTTLLVLPTGTGKTVVFAQLARVAAANDERTLVLAHRTELLEQAAAKLADVGVTSSIEQGDRKGSARSDVVVASVQTLRGARLERYAHDAFAFIIVDEAHHAAAKSYRDILAHFPNARVLGVTATPDRGDGRALSAVFETVAFTYEMRVAIRDKFLAPLRARRVTVGDLDLSAIKTSHGDLDQGELAKQLTAEKALHGVVSPLLQLAGSRRTLVFGVDVAHAKALAEILNRHKAGSAIALDGKASATERKGVLSLFRAGRFQFLVNCALFTEGFDEPSIECVAMARPTLSRALYTQMVGRGTRLSHATGKTECLVLDFVGNSGRHRLVGPADALAGITLDDETRAIAEKKLEDGQLQLEEVLVFADDEIAKKRAEKGLVALALYRTKEIDPFIGDFMPPLDPDSPLGRSPATEKQIEALEKWGFGTPPPGLTKGEASRMLDAAAAREKAGLAAVAQCRLLGRLGIDTRTLTKVRAGQLFSKCRALGFKKWVLAHEPEAIRSARKA